MRPHFNTCMPNGSMTAVRRQPAFKCVDIDIYCSCRLPDNEGERMVLRDKYAISLDVICLDYDEVVRNADDAPPPPVVQHAHTVKPLIVNTPD